MGDVGEMRISVTTDGPYEVEGHVPLRRRTIVANAAGDSVEWADGEVVEASDSYRLCRCGHSKTKPFCDDSHLSIGFDGTEVASHQPYAELATTQRGPRLVLTDAHSYCSSARFCDPGEGMEALIATDSADAAEEAIRRGLRCPSGRLVVHSATTGEAYEPELEPSIGLIEDPEMGCSGGLWVRGGIPVVGADGQPYEVRNRVTLCRCGNSENKPFCDGTHLDVHFRDQ
jgi:CDGSH-type Zn-finger protein